MENFDLNRIQDPVVRQYLEQQQEQIARLEKEMSNLKDDVVRLRGQGVTPPAKGSRAKAAGEAATPPSLAALLQGKNPVALAVIVVALVLVVGELAMMSFGGSKSATSSGLVGPNGAPVIDQTAYNMYKNGPPGNNSSTSSSTGMASGPSAAVPSGPPPGTPGSLVNGHAAGETPPVGK